jgi:hypothetical protein
MTNKGIDYAGPLGTCNRDPETGIRYGIVPSSACAEWFWDNVEPEYDPSCPACGTELSSDFETPGPCPRCEADIRDGEEFGDEPSRNVLADGEIEGFVDSMGDVWVTKSPYFTRAAFCSPCAPGACYLTSPCDDGERAYCLGPDWFEAGELPYPVYSVETGERIG